MLNEVIIIIFFNKTITGPAYIRTLVFEDEKKRIDPEKNQIETYWQEFKLLQIEPDLQRRRTLFADNDAIGNFRRYDDF
jgi:hypothetical protein